MRSNCTLPEHETFAPAGAGSGPADAHCRIEGIHGSTEMRKRFSGVGELENHELAAEVAARDWDVTAYASPRRSSRLHPV